MDFIYEDQLLEIVWSNESNYLPSLYDVKTACFKWLENKPPIEDSDTRIVIEFLLEHALIMKQMGEKNIFVAKETFKEILKVHKENPIALYRLAYIYYSKSAWKIAQLFFEKAYKMNFQSLYFNLKNDQLVKTQLYIAECHIRLAREAFSIAVEENEDLDLSDRDIGIEAESLLEIIKEQFDLNRYELYRKNKKSLVSRGHIDYVYENLDLNEILLFDDGRQWYLVCGERDKEISPALAFFIKVITMADFQMVSYELFNQLSNRSYDVFRRYKSDLSKFMLENFSIKDLFSSESLPLKTIKINSKYKFSLAIPTDDSYSK
ncbi:hypothetical protein [Jeotgalibacillus sp. R-1-5s-1]|uniref:hypothetical protein n=1 Tax=Jeotgalibacillus sp. R-1-5s-1 TaxID=2555897 RepID=UPI00106D84B6|nr:hypothetical protein [Jeotgalibacillus sp. R-1-5s-1]TFD99523.1 hypothetical protein E2491_07360 [Jeotgalibacillus sp. R-1-5s-1]